MAASGRTSRHAGEEDRPLGAKRQLHGSTPSDTLPEHHLAAAAADVDMLEVHVSKACITKMITE